MRVSTSQIYYSGTNNMLNSQAEMYKTQNQLATGRKNLTPRDNPIEATLALLTTQAKGVNANFLNNQGVASDQLALMDTQLGSVSDLLQDVIERGIQGGNGAYNAQQKQAIAEDLKRRFEGLVDLANTRNGVGDYIFSGNRTNVQPFTVTGSGGNYDLAGVTSVTYNGDDGRRLLQVESSQTVATSESGQDVFLRVMDANGSFTGRSIFDAVKNMIDVLDPASGVVPPPDYSQALGDLNASLDHVLRVRTSVGARMNQMDALTNAGMDLAGQYEARLLELEGLDYAEAISRLSEQKMQLEASQMSFSKVTQLSLFSLL